MEIYPKVMEAYKNYMSGQLEDMGIDDEPDFLVLDLVSNVSLQRELKQMNDLMPSLGIPYGVKFNGIRIAIARLDYNEERQTIIKFVGGWDAP